MLAIQKQPNYLRKTVQLPNGAWALVTFELVELNGKIIARAVSGTLIPDLKKEEEVLCLPCIKSPAEFVPVKSIFSNLVSTFSKDFSFIMSQPTRAPAYN
ncbi:MAG: hypothetical protein WCP24_00380 [bacterium]